jgi:hypothetical protein
MASNVAFYLTPKHHIHTEDTNSNNPHCEVLEKKFRRGEMADTRWPKDLYI